MKHKIIGVILGGGAGTRLYPLTLKRSKPAVPIGGKYRLIDIPISNCLNSGINQMFVLTQYNSASLNQHIQNSYHFDHFGRGFVDIMAAEQTPTNRDWFQGTADAVRQTFHHFHNQDYDYVLILSGDQLYQMDLNEMLEFHISQAADLTIATIPVVAKDAPAFGIMKVNGESYIERFIEKPAPELLPEWTSEVADEYKAKGKDYLASMGIYIFSMSALSKLFETYPDETDFGKGIIPAAITNGYKTASYQYNGYWTDIGSVDSFFEANIAMTEQNPEFNLFDDKQIIYTRPRLLPPSKLFGTAVNQAVIAEGCELHAKQIDKSLIGIRSKIGKGTVVKSSIIMGADFYGKEGENTIGIGENCHIENAIVDKNCVIGNNVTICGDASLSDSETDEYVIKDGIIVVKKKAVIADNTVVGKPVR